MKTRLLIAGLLVMLGTLNLKAQFVVTDPVNLAQSIVNSANEIVQTSNTVSNVIKNFQEVKKVYEQGKEYYDALKAVNNLVKDARKVQETILMVGEIADIYINSYQFTPPQSTFASDSTFENLFGLFNIESRGENPEEEAFIRRMKRKRRKKRKL
jgi:adenylosuccinate synthase